MAFRAATIVACTDRKPGEMYLLPQAVDDAAFRFFPYLILPVIAVGLIALTLYLLKHRLGKRRS